MSDRAGPHDVTDIVAERAPAARRRVVAMWSGGSVVRDLPDNGVIDVGRGEDAAVRIEHGSISRKHARLHLGPDVRIEDLGSSNGTFVDGMKLPSGGIARVAPGVVVELGSVMLVVRDSAASGTRESWRPPGDVVVCD